jgi:hypothetical protein
MTRAAAPQKTMMRGLACSIRSTIAEHIGTRQKTLGRRRDFGGLACHRASGTAVSHRRAWTR